MRQQDFQTCALPAELQRHERSCWLHGLNWFPLRDSNSHSRLQRPVSCQLDEAEFCPTEIGLCDSVEDEDFINGHAQHMCENHHVINRGHCIAPHPFEDRLRRMEAEFILNISDLETFVFQQRFDIRAGCCEVDRRRIGRHKNTTFLTEHKKTVCARFILHTDGFVLSEDGSQ